MKRLMTLLLGFAALAGCTSPQSEQHVKNELRAPAYPLVTIDPYTRWRRYNIESPRSS